MTNDSADPRSVELAFREAISQEDSQSIVLHSAWLPLAIWDEVEITREVEIGLTLFERYVLECVLELGACTPLDLLQVASIPSELANWILMSLQQKGLVFRDGSSVLPHAARCAGALKDQAVLTTRSEKACFLWLPESGEVILMGNPGGLLRRMRNLLPAGSFPLPADLRGQTRGRVIAQALRSGQMVGPDAGSLRGVKDDSPLAQTIPAYHVRGQIPACGDSGLARLVLVGSGRVKRREGNAHESEIIEVDLPLPPLPYLPDMWRSQVIQMLASRGEDLQRDYPGCVVEVSTGTPMVLLDEPGVSQLAEQFLLVDSLGLEIRAPGSLHCELASSLQPAPGAIRARHILCRDRVVRQLLNSRSPLTSESLDQVCIEQSVDRSDIVDRLWNIRQYRRIYELRESGDFSDA